MPKSIKEVQKKCQKTPLWGGERVGGNSVCFLLGGDLNNKKAYCTLIHSKVKQTNNGLKCIFVKILIFLAIVELFDSVDIYVLFLVTPLLFIYNILQFLLCASDEKILLTLLINEQLDKHSCIHSYI